MLKIFSSFFLLFWSDYPPSGDSFPFPLGYFCIFGNKKRLLLCWLLAFISLHMSMNKINVHKDIRCIRTRRSLNKQIVVNGKHQVKFQLAKSSNFVHADELMVTVFGILQRPLTNVCNLNCGERKLRSSCGFCFLRSACTRKFIFFHTK